MTVFNTNRINISAAGRSARPDRCDTVSPRSGITNAAGKPAPRGILCLFGGKGTVMQPGKRIGNRILTSSVPRRVWNSIDRALDSVLEPLESRWMLAVTATSAGGVLSIVGDDGANAITVSRDAAGNLLVNGGAVPIVGTP